jgi:hypothetical protein
MPNSNLTTNAKAAMTAPETNEVLLNLLTISYDGQAILRVTDNKETIQSGGEDYEPCGFKILLPDQTSDGNKTCRLQIDNTDISIYRTIKSAVIQSRNEKKEITCTAAVIMASEPDNYIEGPLSFILRNIKADVNSITGELYDSYMHDRKFTILTYNPDDFPGLFF